MAEEMSDGIRIPYERIAAINLVFYPIILNKRRCTSQLVCFLVQRLFILQSVTIFYFTVTVHRFVSVLPALDFTETVITAVPFFFALIIPFLLTDAIVGAEDL